jgi:hypothetical protein
LGNLAKILQEEIERIQPWGMNVKTEFKLLSAELEKTLGFSPRVDLLLEKEDGSLRYWIEFEISRADPVANHTKFATSCLFQPFSPNNVFISMASNHVARGRNNLGASTIALMRHTGIMAFQTTLLPQFEAKEIKRLNHMSLEQIRNIKLEVEPEIDRIALISESLANLKGRKVHFAANPFEVYLNLHNWNLYIDKERCQEIWKKRTIKYFVFNPWTKQFAPSKFCAYTIVPEINKNSNQNKRNTLENFSMTIPLYSEIDQNISIFDGQKARLHLTKNLGFSLIHANEDEKTNTYFNEWMKSQDKILNVAQDGPWFIN